MHKNLVLATLTAIVAVTAAAPASAAGITPLGSTLGASGAPPRAEGPSLGPDTRRVRVDCDRGQTITQALRAQAPSLAVSFVGTCRERVVIERDDVVLEGGSPDATVVGSVAAQGASRVALRHFTVRDTPGDDPFSMEGDGVSILDSQGVVIEGITTMDTHRRGISMEGSAVDIIDSKVLRANNIGIMVITSFVNFVGDVTSDGSAITGICVVMSSHVFVRPGAHVVVRRNLVGILSEVNGVVTLASQSLVTAEDNILDGVGVTAQGNLVLADAIVESHGNGGYGLLVGELSYMTVFVGTQAQLFLSGNQGGGLRVEKSSYLQIDAGVHSTDNVGPGLSVEDSRVVLGGAEVRDNAAGDVFLGFNARVSFGAGNDFGSPVACDGPVLTQGTPGCEVQAAAPQVTAVRAGRSAVPDPLAGEPPVPEVPQP